MSPEPGSLPILDTHQHLWELERFDLPWLRGHPVLDRSFGMADYLDAARGLGVAQTVYMEVDVVPEQHAAEAEYVIDLCGRSGNPMAAAVIGGRPASAGFGAYLDRFRGIPEVKGVRQVLHGGGTAPGFCREPEFVRGIRRLGERGLSFDLCMRPDELLDGAWLADTCPDTRFILDHCGNPRVQDRERSRWAAGLAEVARRENVVCKVSGIVASTVPGEWTAADLAPIVTRVLAEFGPERVMFGGDWPVCTRAATLSEWVEALRWIVRDRSPAEQRLLFHDNAARFYGLAPDGPPETRP